MPHHCRHTNCSGGAGFSLRCPDLPEATSMTFLTSSQRGLLVGVSRLGYANPFLPERVELERAVLGGEFLEGEAVWSYRAEHPEPRANVWRIGAKLEPLVKELGARLRSGVPASERELGLYEDAALQLLYQGCYAKFYEAGFGGEQSNPGRWRFYNEFLADWRQCFAMDGVSFPNERDARHTFACFRQIQRAFDITFRDIIGSSLPAARLRGAVWQSIFTHAVSYTHLRAHETVLDLVCRLLLEKK